MADEVKIWNKVLASAMALPGVKVNRREFLTHTLLPYCEREELNAIINGEKPVTFLSLDVIDKLVDECIKYQLARVTTASAIAGFPGGWALIATIPADMAQYYYHVFVLSQKMAYLYGFPDLIDEKGCLSEDAQNTLTLFTGVMQGSNTANKAIQELAKSIAEQTLKQLPKYALTKTVIHTMVKQVAKWIGINMTKGTFTRTAFKVFPFIGSVFSATFTYSTFISGAKNLKQSLHDCALIMIRPKQSTESENIDFVEE